MKSLQQDVFQSNSNSFYNDIIEETFTGATSLICARAAIALSMSIDAVK
jgi:hypothetical protein